MGSNKFTYVGRNFELYDFTTSWLRSSNLLPYTKSGENLHIFIFSDLSKSVQQVSCICTRIIGTATFMTSLAPVHRQIESAYLYYSETLKLYELNSQWSRAEFTLRHFQFCGLSRENFVYFCTKSLNSSNRKTYMVYRVLIALYWVVGWAVSMANITKIAKYSYFSYFANWTDTILLIYFWTYAGVVLYEYNIWSKSRSLTTRPNTVS